MFLKLKAVFFASFFLACLFISVCRAEIIVPLPEDTVKVSEESNNLGTIKQINQIFESSLKKNKIISFYKKEMSQAGWIEQKDLVYVKGKNMAMIVISQEKNPVTGRTLFVISTSEIPSAEEINAVRKKNPDKLNFMPIYAGSEQVYLTDLPNGVMGLYETGDSIKDVVFFYKSGMLNYGWSLKSETPIKSDLIDCPECRKGGWGEKKADSSGSVATGSQTTLTFQKENNEINETCRIMINNVVVDMSKIGANNQTNRQESVYLPTQGPISKTSISILYNIQKNVPKSVYKKTIK